jgi:hypothetical protein
MNDVLSRHPHAAAFLVFSILALIFFSRALGNDFIFRDNFHEYYPLKLLYGWVLAGCLPLWSPHTCLGMALAGSVFPGLWYPVNWLLFPLLHLSADHAAMAYTLLHYAAAGAGMVFMLRRLGVGRQGAGVGAVAYAFSGSLVSMHFAVNLLGGMALLPLAAGLMAKARNDGLKWSFTAGIVTGLIFLGGDPQAFALASLTSLLVFVALRPAKTDQGQARMGPLKMAAGILIFLAAAISGAAAELLPSLAVTAESARAHGVSFADATCWSTPPLRMVEFFLARPFGDPWPLNRYWGAFMGERCFPLPLIISPYAGVWTLAAGALALRSWKDGRVLLFTALLLFFLALALGRYTPVYELFFRAVPGLNAFRYPEKYLVMVAFSLAALAGLGTERIIRAPEPGGKRSGEANNLLRGLPLAAPLVAIILTAAAGVAGHVWRAEIGQALAPLLARGHSLAPPDLAADDLVQAMTRTGFFISLSLLVLSGCRNTRHRFIGYAPALLLFLDLFLSNAALAPAAPGLDRMGSRLAEIIMAREGKSSCVFAPSNGPPQLEPWCCAANNFKPCLGPGEFRLFRDNSITSPPGLTYEELRRWERETLKPNLGVIDGFEYIGGINVAGPERFRWMMDNVITLFDLPRFNVKYAIIPVDQAPGPGSGTKLLAQYRGVALIEFEEVFPRAFWVGGSRIARNEDEIASLFARTDFKKHVLVEPGPDQGKETREEADAGYSMVAARVLSYFPDRVEIRVNAPAPGWLVENDLFYPGWTATLDGAPVPIRRANGMVRAVRLSAGEHTVVFKYMPPLLIAGLALTGAAWIACMVLIVPWRRRRSRAEGEGRIA